MDEKLKQIKLDSLQKGHETQTRRAIERYYADPAICLNCGKVIELDGKQKPSQIKKKKFCNQSCAAKFNNLGKDRWEKHRDPKIGKHIFTLDGSPKSVMCISCKKKVTVIPTKRCNRKEGYHYYHRKYCDECANLKRSAGVKNKNRKIASKSRKIDTVAIKKETLFELIDLGLTKGELKKLTSDHGYYGWKGRMTKHARKVYTESGQEFKCRKCGFDFHVHVCHVKDIAEFSDDDKISDINALNNLIALCPNHHVMFDRKAIEI